MDFILYLGFPDLAAIDPVDEGAAAEIGDAIAVESLGYFFVISGWSL